MDQRQYCCEACIDRPVAEYTPTEIQDTSSLTLGSTAARQICKEYAYKYMKYVKLRLITRGSKLVMILENEGLR